MFREHPELFTIQYFLIKSVTVYINRRNLFNSMLRNKELRMVQNFSAEPSTVLYDCAEPSTVLYDCAEPSTVLYDCAEPSIVLYDCAEPSIVLYDCAEPSWFITSELRTLYGSEFFLQNHRRFCVIAQNLWEFRFYWTEPFMVQYYRSEPFSGFLTIIQN